MTKKTNLNTPDDAAESLDVAADDAVADYPGPTSNPPGGGSWRWDSPTQAWVENLPVN